MKPINRSLLCAAFSGIMLFSNGVDLYGQPIAESKLSVSTRPYKVMTTGNQITVRSNRDIKTIMIWTAAGTRILEKTIHASVFSFRVPTNHKMVFVRIELANGDTFTEKIGVN